ncbi:MAG TPA: chemotaxis response regulator protein-glutamate methylesterase [Verrucomicrobiae bacterium]|nr:chemotaxis response regulator protein-glutamate methylesterase [Verrucomicrobiae bacterium]
MNQLIRTLIVDDSAFVRKVVREMLSRCPYIEVVGAARDGQEALELAQQLNPQVITCDLMMPKLDGVGFVREQMSRAPIPILILTASPEDGERALLAMDAGAVDIVQKPTALANDDLLGIREQLVDKVKAASRAPVGRPRPRPAKSRIPMPGGGLRPPSRADIVVIGISTGGPQALRHIIPQFPAQFSIPIAVVLHMPVGYTHLYAQKLNELCALNVMEAREGEVLEPGKVLVAQAGRHLLVRRSPAGNVVAQMSIQPLDLPHRPAVDVLFQSAAEVYGERVLGVVMTGMGSDGKEGAAWIKARGGTILTEAEESCVIYGMPRVVVEAGLSDGAVPLEQMAQSIMEKI